MPLIVISGLPCSGKTTFAEKLKNYFETKRNIKAKIISEENFYDAGENRNTIYSDSNKEKKLRASMKSGVERELNKESILIFDSLNYVKGSRYELYCVSKCNSTNQCTVYCSISLEEAKTLNSIRNDELKYHDFVLEGLFMRYETPEGRNRWDAPLFHMPFKCNEGEEGGYGGIGAGESDKKEKTASDDADDYDLDDGEDKGDHLVEEEALLSEIHDCLFLKKAPKPHLSTITAPILPENFLHEVDNVTKAVVQEILLKQQDCTPGDKIMITSSNNVIEFVKPFSMVELQRLRRQYVVFSRTHPTSSPSLIPSLFVQYVNSRSEF